MTNVQTLIKNKGKIISAVACLLLIIISYFIYSAKTAPSANDQNMDGKIATIQCDSSPSTAVKTANIKWHSDGQVIIKVDNNRVVTTITQNPVQSLKALSNPIGAASVGYAADGDTVVVLTPGIIELSAENTGTGFSVYENGVYSLSDNE